MTVELVALKRQAQKKMAAWYGQNINNRDGVDHLLQEEMRFATDNATKARSRQWLCSRFPELIGEII